MKKSLSWLNWIFSKKTAASVAVLGVVAGAGLTAALAPIAQHIKGAAGFATRTTLAEKPKTDGVPQSGEVDLQSSGGYPQAGELLGSISIAGTAVDCGIYMGDSPTELHAGAGIWAGGKIFGEQGTVLVAGHTNSFFRDLESVREGADILVQTRYGEYHYRVTGSKIAKEDDSSAYDLEADTENIILYTCYPFGQVTVTDERYFVYGEYVSGPWVKEAADEAN